MNVLSLFSGVGGIDLGLERAGMRVVGQCEVDPAARRVLAQHWPDVPCWPDVRRVALREQSASGDPRNAGPSGLDEAGRLDPNAVPIDLICGGFPCQDLSVAGKRAGLDGERSGLFFEAARIADVVLGPGGRLLIENVPGLLSSNGGRDFGVVLATLADLGFYDLAWRVLDSRYFGVPQRRRRVFILARRARGDRARQVLLEPESGGGNFAPGREAGSRVAETLTRGSAKPGVSAPGRRQEDDMNIVANSLDRQAGGPDDNSAQANHLVPALTQSPYADNEAQHGKLISHTLTAGGYDASEDGTGRGTPLTAFNLRGREGGAQVEVSDVASLRAASGGSSRSYLGGEGGVRRLTPTECERLQGFPDGWTIPDGSDWRDYPKPDGPRYAQMGNAVTVNVAEWIGRRLVSCSEVPA